MKVLIGKTFGIGNTVLSIPMIKAVSAVADEVAVLVGNTQDDYGAATVLNMFNLSAFIPKGFRLLLTPPGTSEKFDVAIMAIPYDGRWKNGSDYLADRVLDERRRPGNVDRLGFDMWKKHEVEYQMENAYELGYGGTIPGSTFISAESGDPDLVYLGIGYKRDIAGFGASKHLGEERFAQLIDAVRARRPKTRFVSTGNSIDLIQTATPIMKMVGDNDVYSCETSTSLAYGFTVLSRCGSYLGNDTGMMHVAASLEMPVHGIFLSDNLVRKNHPWTSRWSSSLLTEDVGTIADRFVSLLEDR